MAKLTEKQLYETWLDISFANDLNEDFLHDLEIELKEMRKHRNKTRRYLKKAAEAYRKVHGRAPQCKPQRRGVTHVHGR